MDRTNVSLRWTLAAIAGTVVCYCVLVLVVVATAPDLRMRFLLVEPDEVSAGIRIKQTQGLITIDGQNIPGPDDILLEVAGQSVTTSLDFLREQFALRSREYDGRSSDPPSARRESTDNVRQEQVGTDDATGHPIVNTMDSLRDWRGSDSPIVRRDAADYVRQNSRGTWVEIKYRQQGRQQIQTTEVKIQSAPLREVGLTLVWFLLEMVIFSVGAVAFWSRPFDDAARMFFAMCTVTLAAFVGGFHWWTVGSSFWLTLPFAVCGILLPAVILHFFMVYPRPKPPLTLWPRAVMSAIYAIPAVTIMAFVVVDGLIWFLMASTVTHADSSRELSQIKLVWLHWLQAGIYSYLCVAALYFLATLVSLRHSWLTTRNPIERNQIRWILIAGCAASFFIGYALKLAFFNREDFALGGARVPMFFASLVFMFAYAVGIVRYKLMLIDQIVNRGMSYYVLSYGATASVALLIACGTLMLAVRKTQAFEQPTFIMAGILMLAVLLLIWLRDSWQMFVDRRFFREKYRLDKALQRMNQAVGRMAEVEFLSERMLMSCRDVLQSELAALYLRDARTSNYRLVGAEGDSAGLPMNFTAPDEFSQALQADPTLQRVTSGSRDSMTPTQSLLRQVRADLVHGLETNGELTGVVVLGSKLNGLMYSAEDLTFLTALGQITGIALHSASVHQNLKHLNEELRSKVDQIAQQRQQIAILQSELSTNRVEPLSTSVIEFRREAIVGHSPPLEQVLDMVRKVAPSDTSVLVRGESGTGKELLAKAIHENSPRRDGPLISVHCAALSAGLLESELFGHVKGSFTGAHSDKQGRFELAQGGTLFLDEIGDISAETQVKLLRVLQQREFEPVGGTKTIQVDVRLVAATHQNLERLIAEGKFREDLYYRLNVISIVLPPLRERPDDILDLAVYFLKAASTRGGKRIARFDDDALNALLQYHWPGNIRELQNVIERAVVLAERETVEFVDLPVEIQNSTAGRSSPADNSTLRNDELVNSQSWTSDDPQAERQMLIDTLKRCHGNKTKAAKQLGLPRSTYFSKLKKYGIADSESTEPPRYGRIPR